MKKLMLLLLACMAVRATHRPHPKFPKSLEEHDIPLLKKVPCTSEQHRERSALMQQARCGAPREVFVELKPRAAYEEIHPGAVWVRRCVGLCDHEGADSKCVPLETTVRNIPIKVFNVKTGKESCSVYPVEEHASCGCCAGAAAGAGCAAPRVFNPPELEYEVESV